MAIKLSVNLDKIALIRNSRDGNKPDLIKFAKLAMQSGSDSITVHPRPDLRHIVPNDVYKLSKIPKIKLNIEGNPFSNKNINYPGYLEIVSKVLPYQCTLVPDNDNQKTSDHGWDLDKNAQKLEPVIKRIKELPSEVSLFIDANKNDDYKIAKQLGVDSLELYTEELANSLNTTKWEETWQKYYDSAIKIKKLNIKLNAGHDLNQDNLKYVSKLPGLIEVSIGHSLVIDSLLTGWNKTISEYKNLLG